MHKSSMPGSLSFLSYPVVKLGRTDFLQRGLPTRLVPSLPARAVQAVLSLKLRPLGLWEVLTSQPIHFHCSCLDSAFPFFLK